MTKDEQIAYCIGFFDGEGCVTIAKGTDKRRGLMPRYQVMIRASQKRNDPLLMLQAVFGGRVYLVKRNGFSTIWLWVLSSVGEQTRFLETAVKLLLGKRLQAEVALEFLRTIHADNTTPRDSLGRIIKTSDTLMQKKEQLFNTMKSLRKAEAVIEDENGQREFPTPVGLFDDRFQARKKHYALRT